VTKGRVTQWITEGLNAAAAAQAVQARPRGAPPPDSDESAGTVEARLKAEKLRQAQFGQSLCSACAWVAWSEASQGTFKRRDAPEQTHKIEENDAR
jgi:hypothetical protein